MELDREEARASFSAIASVDLHTADTFLAATNYNVDEAVDLYFAHGMDGAASGLPKQSDAELAQMLAAGNDSHMDSARSGASGGASEPDHVRAPIPAKLDRLYEDMPYFSQPRHNGQGAPQREVNAFRDFEDEGKRGRGRGPRDGSDSSRQREASLGAMFEPPLDLMFRGNFETAQQQAQTDNKWLLINLQSNQEFASHQLNRDTWSDTTLKAILKGSFIFLQLDISSEEGQRFQAYYKVYELPAIVVVDPITGSAMKNLSKFLSAERLMEEIVTFMDHSPEDPSAQKLTTAQHRRKLTPPPPETYEAMSEDKELEQALALSMASAMPAAEIAASTNGQPNTSLPALSAEQRDASGSQPQSETKITPETQQKDAATVQEEAKASLPPASDAIGGPAVALTNEGQTLGDAGLANSLVAMTWAS